MLPPRSQVPALGETFGGVEPIGLPYLATHELVGDQWLTVPLVTSPPLRAGHLLVYDAARRVVMTFGGGVPQPGMSPPPETPLGDTWIFDGNAWTDVTPGTSPEPRRDVAGAYHASTEEVVIFGGEDDATVFDDTWAWDGASSAEVSVAGPPARHGHRMAYDAQRDRTVLFGGRDAGGAPLTDTWEWDGTSWSELTTATTIPAAKDTMAYHAGLGRVVLYGGAPPAAPSTWELDGTDWAPLMGPSPPPRYQAAAAYDAGRDALVVSGGAAGPNGVPIYDDLWALGASGWQQVALEVAPSPRFDARLAYDALRREMLLFGGIDAPTVPNGTARNDLWSWGGRFFERLDTLNTPPVTTPAMAFLFDSARGKVVMLRPAPSPARPLETWELTGRVWQRVTTATEPPSRRHASVTYDPNRARVVMFGGFANDGALDDTWEYDGVDWSLISTANAPSPRRLAMSAYDAHREILVLFGRDGVAQRSTTPGSTTAATGYRSTRPRDRARAGGRT